MENKKTIANGIVLLKQQCKHMSDEQLIIYLEGHHKSDVYMVLHNVLDDSRKAILSNKFSERYDRVLSDANKAHAHDMKHAKNIDVDRACSIVYGTLLRMIKAQQDNISILLDKVSQIEKHLGISVVNEDEKRGDTI